MYWQRWHPTLSPLLHKTPTPSPSELRKLAGKRLNKRCVRERNRNTTRAVTVFHGLLILSDLEQSLAIFSPTFFALRFKILYLSSCYSFSIPPQLRFHLIFFVSIQFCLNTIRFVCPLVSRENLESGSLCLVSRAFCGVEPVLVCFWSHEVLVVSTFEFICCHKRFMRV